MSVFLLINHCHYHKKDQSFSWVRNKMWMISSLESRQVTASQTVLQRLSGLNYESFKLAYDIYSSPDIFKQKRAGCWWENKTLRPVLFTATNNACQSYGCYTASRRQKQSKVRIQEKIFQDPCSKEDVYIAYILHTSQPVVYWFAASNNMYALVGTILEIINLFPPTTWITF